jgi:hypothetical protein
VPTNPIITLSPDQLDSIAGGTFPSEVTLPLGPVAVQYPANTYLDRGDQITLAIIIESMEERPIFFATPSGILGRLGLEPWTVRHGLAAKLIPRDLNQPSDPGLLQTSPGFGEDWFDVERSLALVENVYSYRGLEDRKVWADRSTLNIPWYFYLTAVQLADVVSRWEGGSPEQVEWLQRKSEAFLVTARGGRLAFTDSEEEG